MARKHAATTTAKVKPPLPPVPRLSPASVRPAPAAPGLRAIEAAPPALSLHRAGSLAVLRIHDLSYSAIVSVIAQALPADAGHSHGHEDVQSHSGGGASCAA